MTKQEIINNKVGDLIESLIKALYSEKLTNGDMIKFGSSLQKCKTRFKTLLKALGLIFYEDDYFIAPSKIRKINIVCPYCNSVIFNGENKESEADAEE